VCPAQNLSFQSLKKLLPDSCPCMEKEMIEKLVENLMVPAAEPPPGFLQFVRREVSRLFPKGWDASYEAFCRTTSPPLSSVKYGCPLGGTRSNGGSLGAFTDEKWLQHDFLDVVCHGTRELPPRLTGYLMVAQSAGKPRPLSKFDYMALAMRPLHKTVYSHLSQKPWLCRGDVDAEKLARAGFSFGKGVLTSGDYKSATDGLNRTVSQVILDTLLGTSSFVPQGVREYASGSLAPLLSSSEYDIDEFVPERGQMMGSYLSFPLLCLYNFLCFRWVCKQNKVKRLPVLINGDDILFQSTREFSDSWMQVLPSLSLTVETVKTSVSSEYGSLNSTLFSWKDGLLSRVPTLRMGMLKQVNEPNGLGKSYHDFIRAMSGQERWRAAWTFFEFHSGTLRNFKYSLPSLGFRGALADRIARKFDLYFSRSDVCVPARKHAVEVPSDLISKVPIGALSAEESHLSAAETAGWKWGHGWKAVVHVSEAIAWSLETSGFRNWSSEFEYARCFWADDLEFEFILRNAREVEKESRRTRWLAYASPLPKRQFDRVFSSVVYLHDIDFGRGELPPYSVVEEKERCGRASSTDRNRKEAAL